ncbi:SDR family oxidoreductase [Paenibacillus xerothermodurans]|uniref:LPS biosynthesis protein WbpP n=1 Tax=Paenibacillus xerothermodurans TaxID=1977292 RepID=A0A2W1P006_PAEXE|nr:SDR family oxidoreductase [Paenibacillus xerothermodurans]PZE20468.1 LPS biosynthesis protein WbpP [Paenibacillus xerothermodurans]
MGYTDISFPSGTTFLISGGAGFIGSNLAEAILEMGHKVRIIDDLSNGKYEHILELKEKYDVEFIENSIAEYDACQKACEGIDYVLHQAAWGSVPRSIKIPLVYDTNNVHGTLNMMQAAVEAGVKKFVYASSSSVYGDEPVLPKVEGKIGKPLSPYAITKLVNELYARNFYELYGLKTVGLRYFNVFGRRQDPLSTYAAVIPVFVKALLNDISPTINGDGSQTRDFTYIENVIEANLKACVAGDEANGESFNIAFGRSTSLNDLYEQLCMLLGKNIPPTYGPARAGDIPHSLADISKARKLLNYNPDYDINAGLEKTIDWYKQHLSVV